MQYKLKEVFYNEAATKETLRSEITVTIRLSNHDHNIYHRNRPHPIRHYVNNDPFSNMIESFSKW
ncbi:hypothetical protein NLX69_00270 [Rossellomorea sp. BNER]|nr:hypothetical protein [Rossellomorea sp. BNER]